MKHLFTSLLFVIMMLVSWNTQASTCDCDPADINPVCAVNEEGELYLFPSACIAECEGFEVTDEDCGNTEDTGGPSDPSDPGDSFDPSD